MNKNQKECPRCKYLWGIVYKDKDLTMPDMFGKERKIIFRETCSNCGYLFPDETLSYSKA